MQDTIESKESRRNFLVKCGLLFATTGFWGVAGCSEDEKGSKAWKVSPTEDLMREHGILRRIMLIYDGIGKRLKQGEEFPLQALAEANNIMRRFIQDYHEKNEQLQIFNRFSNAGKLVELVATLYQQHLAGRNLIDKVRILSTEENLKDPAERVKIAEFLNTFNQMGRRHAAWEDTVLFPAFRSIISSQDFTEVGETFEREEEKLFGLNGYEKVVRQVADIEKKLGIYDLKEFTPRL
jgi:hemerythrin-like domain-containing protein